MLVVDYKAGQLANRLFHFSYFIAHSLEHNYKVINPCFEEYKLLFDMEYLEEMNSNSISFSFVQNDWLNEKITQVINRIRGLAKRNKGKFYPFEFFDIRGEFDIAYKEFDMSNPEFIEKIKHKILFVKGWNYRDKIALQKHKASIKKIFTPKTVYRDVVQEVLNTAKENGDVCIGVHIRKGDYRDFFDGRWYYDNDVYTEKMNVLKDVFAAKGKRCVFLACSNEPVKRSDFQGIEIIPGEHSPLIDLYALAGCDYLIGPPSTFTMWASFYGEVPLLMLKNKEVLPLVENFKIYQGVESFF
jgi:hypothetical protein